MVRTVLTTSRKELRVLSFHRKNIYRKGFWRRLIRKHNSRGEMTDRIARVETPLILRDRREGIEGKGFEKRRRGS